jgi:hypothetical protein
MGKRETANTNCGYSRVWEMFFWKKPKKRALFNEKVIDLRCFFGYNALA